MFVRMRRSPGRPRPLAAHPRPRRPRPRRRRRHRRERRRVAIERRLPGARARLRRSAATGCTSTAAGHGGPPSCCSTASASSPRPGPASPARSARTTRVCAYDRAGQGWSDDVDQPAGRRRRRRGPARPARRRRRARPVRAGRALHRRPLRDDLRRAATPSRSPAWCCWTAPAPSSSPRCPAYPGQYALMRRGLALLPTLARLGLGSVSGSGSRLPGAAASQVAGA